MTKKKKDYTQMIWEKKKTIWLANWLKKTIKTGRNQLTIPKPDFYTKISIIVQHLCAFLNINLNLIHPLRPHEVLFKKFTNNLMKSYMLSWMVTNPPSVHFSIH